MKKCLSRRRWLAAAGLCLAAGWFGAARAAVQPLKVGAMAPAFALSDQDGKIRHLSDYKGRNLVLAFYPKDFTFG